MAFDPAPQAFFGPGYSLASNKIQLATSTIADILIGKLTMTGTTAVISVFDEDTGLVATPHNLKVGDKVALTSSGTLPAPFTTADHFVVSVPTSSTLTISLTKGGAAIVSTDTGSGTHRINALGALQETNDTEAHADTGDYRKVVHALMELLYQKHINTPTADRSTRVTVFKSKSSNSQTGIDTDNYSVSIQTMSSGSEVIDE